MAEHYFGITDTGKLRDNNEDTFIAEPVLKGGFIAACVIDGVGGYEGGEVAAATARAAILDYFTVPSGAVPAMMREALLSANEKICAEKTQGHKNSEMACVLTLAVIEKGNNKFYYAHVGDTRLYLFRDQSLVKVTKDHSFVGFLEDTGRLNESAAMAHPKRNEINKALGFDAPILNPTDYIETGESPFLPGDILLLCSDGLSDMVNRKEITSILTDKKSLEERGKALVNAANAAGGKDNITVVLVQNDHKPLKQKRTRPAIQIKKNDRPRSEPVSAPQQTKTIELVPATKTKKGKSLMMILSIVCAVFLVAFLWQWLKKDDIVQPSPALLVTAEPQNLSQQKLQDTINKMSGNTIVLDKLLFGDTVFLNKTLLIQKDSLHIKGTGNVICTRNDSSTSATPSIVISNTVTYILLDGLSLQNIDIGIGVENSQALHFKNVRFQNVGIQTAQRFSFGDSLYTGTIKELALPKIDSLPKR